MNAAKNLKIWLANQKTATDSTKKARLGGREITSINAVSQLEMATKQFGPYGKGFGLSSTEFGLIEAGGGQKMAHLKATFFFVDEDGKHEFPISSTIMLVAQTKNGLYVDKDWAKKIETDVTTKALSKLGFNADIFKGNWDDNKYVMERKREEELEQQRHDAIESMIQSKFKGEKQEFTEILMNIEPQEQAKWIELFNGMSNHHERTEVVEKLGFCKNRQERQAQFSLMTENLNMKV